MKQPDEKTLRAMVNLRATADFTTFLAWLSAARDDQRAANDHLRSDSLVEGAVKAQQLTELLDHTNNAPDSLARIVSGRRIVGPGPV